MAETKTTRGRKSTVAKEKTTVEATTVTEEQDINTVMAKMQEQILSLQKQLQESTKQVEKADKQKTELEQLVEILKSDTKEEKNLPKKVKVISLMPNHYNLTTEEGGRGKQFVFKTFGDMVTMKTSELEEVLSVQTYRKQAEEGYFYILDKDIVEDQDLTEYYEKISNKETLEKVIYLENDECVEIFCGLSKEMQESLASKMAEMLNEGTKLDRNRIKDISIRTDIDIEKIAENFKKSKAK